MAGIIGTLVKLVDSKYRTEQAELRADFAAAKEEAKATVVELKGLHRECEKDRLELSKRVAVLEHAGTK